MASLPWFLTFFCLVGSISSLKRTKRGTYERPSYIVKQYVASQQLRSPPGGIGPQVPINPLPTGYVPVKQPPSPPFVLPTLPPLPQPPPPYVLPTLLPPLSPSPPLPPTYGLKQGSSSYGRSPYVEPAPSPPTYGMKQGLSSYRRRPYFEPSPSPPTYGIKQGPSSYGRTPNVEPPPYYGSKKGYGRQPNVGPSLLYGSKPSYGRAQPSYPTFIEGPFPQGPLSPQPFSPENFGQQFGPTGPFGSGTIPQYPLQGQQLPFGFPGSQALVRASSKMNEYPTVRKTA